MHVNLSIVAVTHGFPGDSKQIGQIVRSQTVVPRQLVIVGVPDPSVVAEFVPPGNGPILALHRALLRVLAPTIVFLDSAYDILPDHVETMLRHVAAGLVPVPTIRRAEDDARPPLPVTSLLACRRNELLGVGGIWGLWHGAAGPDGLWAADVIRRLAAKYARLPREVAVHVQPIAERLPTEDASTHCGIQLYDLTANYPVTANRRCPDALFAALAAPCAHYDIASGECAVLQSNCLAPHAAFGVKKVVRFAKRLPARRIRRAWHDSRRRTAPCPK